MTITGILLCSGGPAHANTPFTAGVVMEKMGFEERFAFVAGIVEGLAYARYRADNRGSTGAEKQTKGIECIYGWFYRSGPETRERIFETFRQFPDHLPGTVVAVLVRKQCGE